MYRVFPLTNLRVVSNNLLQHCRPLPFLGVISSHCCIHIRKAMNNEMTALKSRGTLELIDTFFQTNFVGSKWVFLIKYNFDGYVEKYKACPVQKGYTQTYDIDFFKTFLPIAQLDTIVLLSPWDCVIGGLCINQILKRFLIWSFN